MLIIVHNIALLRISAPLTPFPMPSSNLIGFGTCRVKGTIFVRDIYLFIVKIILNKVQL